MAEKWTAPRIRASKGKVRLACLTACDFFTARLLDEAGFPLVLVGDSLGMTVLGHETTLPVTLADMLHHTAAVARGTRNALVVTDLPFMTYQVSAAQALENAGRCLQAGAAAVKLEGGALRADTVRMLVDNGIPVLGHIGLLPQSVRGMGGFRVQGRSASDIERLLADARALDQAGCFALVVEGVPPDTARQITEAVAIPTIGIGAGPHCDGQVLVVNDLLGMGAGSPPKFVKRYVDLGTAMREAFASYRQDVESVAFPAAEHTYL
jgi:3-methyl-2-oxobutanoate hydroxymethyltransferase